MRTVHYIVVGICLVYLFVTVTLLAVCYSSGLAAWSTKVSQAAVNAVGQATVDAINWTIVALW